MLKTLGTQLARITALVLLAGLGAAILVRFSPGALVDERELNPRMSAETLAALRSAREADNSIGRQLHLYYAGALHGNLGKSQSHNAPILDLLIENTPATVRRLAIGLASAWALGLGLAIPVAGFARPWHLDLATSFLSSLLLSLPAGAIAYLCVAVGAPVTFVLLLVLTPRVFHYTRNLLVQAYGAPDINMARARGIPELRILFAYVFRRAAPQLLGLLAASLSMAIGAIIPIEAICDASGLGRLAWQAAVARDLPLLLNLTMLIALATTAAMAVAEIAACSPSRDAR